MPPSLSLRSRFLVAPIIGVVLTVFLFLSSSLLTRNQTELFQHLHESNLPQVSQISRLSVLITNTHTEFTELMLAAVDGLGEEEIYLGGRKILNKLHGLDRLFVQNFIVDERFILDKQNAYESISQAFIDYRESVLGAIEMSTVNPGLAYREMLKTNDTLQTLNTLMLHLSEYHVDALSVDSTQLEGVLSSQNELTAFAAILIAIMIFSALYFSRRMTVDLDQVNQSLLALSKGNIDVELPFYKEKYLQQLTGAVASFKETLKTNKQQQAYLERTVSELKDNKERYYNLLNTTATGIVVIDIKQNIVLFNKVAESIFGYSSEEVLGENIEILLPEHFRASHTDKIRSFEASDVVTITMSSREPVQALRKNGEVFGIEANIGKLELANETLMTVAVTDITERVAAEEKIRQQAHFDTLTGLPNRLSTLDRLSVLISKAKRKSQSIAVLFIDLDDFKKVNDSLGHETGDLLLIEAAQRMQSLVRSDDTVGRLGGDEFIVLLDGIDDQTYMMPLVDKLLSKLRLPYNINDRDLMISASVGVSIFPGDGENASELLRKADSAMYHAKALGRNTHSFFTEDMNKEAARRLVLEEQMSHALDRGEFYVHYQPLICVKTRQIIGVEALLRWNNETLGEIIPDVFIPLAEQNGLIVELGRFVLTQALQTTKQWQQDCNPNFHVAVNLSSRQLRDMGLVGFLECILHELGISSRSLELEITEGVLMNDYAGVKETLRSLSKLGVRLAMDDFGTGYSSLSYLRNYPFDTLKIDRSFVSGIPEDKASVALVNASIAMAHGLALNVVAEGVETPEQFEHLTAQGCEFLQGYLFGKPVSSEVITTCLREGLDVKTPYLN